MSAPVDIEDRVRSSLRRWAESVEPTPGDPYEAMGRAVDDGPGRSRWGLLAVAAVVVLVVAVAIGVVTRAGRDGVDVGPAATTPSPSSVEATAPAVHVELAPLPYLTFADDGWSVSRLTITPPALSADHPGLHLQLAGPRGQTVEVTVDPLGSWGPGSSPLPNEILTVRGQPAFETHEGTDRFRVTWDEAGLSWMADGEPFASRDELVAVLDHLAIVDEGTWQAWLAPEARAVVTAHPSDGLDYYSGTGAATVATNGPRQPVATVLVPGATVPSQSGRTEGTGVPVPVRPGG